MENGIKMIFGSKWFLILVEYSDSKITFWPPDDISLTYLCWVTYFQLLCRRYIFKGEGKMHSTRIKPRTSETSPVRQQLGNMWGDSGIVPSA